MGRKKKNPTPEASEVVKDQVPRGGRKRNAQNYKSFAYVDGDTTSSEEEDPNICPICENRNDPTKPNDKKNRMIGCDGECDKWFHWSCVGINQTNKPGKDDDWFCKKCSSKKGEAGEWKPEEEDAPTLDVLPLRDQPNPNPEIKTLAQRKSYDQGMEKKTAPTRSNAIFSSQKRRLSKESWETNKNSSPQASTPVSPDQNKNNGVNLPNLPPGISLKSSNDTRSRSVSTESLSSRLPPGISINTAKESETPKPSTIPRLPPGISMVKETTQSKQTEELEDDDSFLDQVSKDNEDDETNPSPLLSPKIKLIRADSVEKPKEPTEKQTRTTRDKREQTARIRATLSEDEISDDELFGGKKVVYKKSKSKVSSKEEELTPVEELLGDGEEEKVTISNNLPAETPTNKKRGRPSKKSIDHSLQNAFREANGLRSKASTTVQNTPTTLKDEKVIQNDTKR